MELMDRNHKDVSRDWLGEVARVFKARPRRTNAPRRYARQPLWGNRLVRDL